MSPKSAELQKIENIKLEEAKKYIGKEVMYSNIIGILQKVNEIGSEEKMIIGYTDNGLCINIILFKCKDEDGSWKDIDL